MTESDPPTIDGFEAALNNVAASIETERLERRQGRRERVIAMVLGGFLLAGLFIQSCVADYQNDQRVEEAVDQRDRIERAAKDAKRSADAAAELVEFVRDLQDPARSAANQQRTQDLLALLLRCSDVDELRGSAEREACFRAEVAALTTTTTTTTPAG
jgi:hypothetical protein